MKRIFEAKLTKIQKDKGLEIRNGANLLSLHGGCLVVVDGNTGKKMKFDYFKKVSDGDTLILRGKEWRKFIGSYDDGATITIYECQGPEANYVVGVK